jgi:uncharacterized protein (TIGR03084 family)
MIELCEDLRAEYAALAALGASLSATQWRQPTAFHGWTPWDEIAHICLLDEVGLLAATDTPAFAARAAELRVRRAAGEEISAIARATYGHLDGPALVGQWTPIFEALVNALAQRAPQDRLPWFGPDMSARSFATARLMETWAHGQDIHDRLKIERIACERLRHIAHLGVSTFTWTFKNRGLPVPDAMPHVALRGPQDAPWTWNEASSTDFVRGSAEDFCLVVTQRRHVLDTGLEFGGSAARWLPIAQCFAGLPANGPLPGVRGSCT